MSAPEYDEHMKLLLTLADQVRDSRKKHDDFNTNYWKLAVELCDLQTHIKDEINTLKEVVPGSEINRVKTVAIITPLVAEIL